MPYIAERLLGVTIPENGIMFACSYDGLHKIHLGEPIRIETDETQSEDYGALRSRGEALGLFDGTPIIADARTTISFAFDPSADRQRVEVHTGTSNEIVTFATMSGDWFVATLSKCGRFLVLAEPCAVEIYQIG